MIYKIEQFAYTTYPKISAKKDFSPVFALILNYVVGGFCPFMKFVRIFLVGWFEEPDIRVPVTLVK